MTEKISIGIDDQSNAGFQSLEKNLSQVDKGADRAEKSLNETAAAADKLGKEGSKAGKDSGLAIVELNQGLEILKKGFELTSRAITALSADGSPAFVRLQDSVEQLQGALLDLATDPAIQSFVDDLAEGIKTKVIPTVSSLPDYWRATQDAVSEFTVSAGAAIGVFSDEAKGTLTEMQQQADELLKYQQRSVELERQREAGQGRIQKITEQVAEQDRLMLLAKMTDQNAVNELLYEEQEQLRSLARQGRETKQQQEESARRIMLLEKRRLEIPREQEEAAKRAAEEAAKAAEQLSKDRQKAAEEAAKAEQDYQQKVQAAVDAANKARQDEFQSMLDALEKKKQELVSLIQQAQGPDGKNMIDATRQQIDPRAVREQLARQAEAEARANWVSPDDNAAKAGARRDAAGRAARMQAFRDFNAGKTSQSDIAGAQNALIQNAAQQAQGRGQVDQQTVDALTQTLQNQQQMIQTQQQQQQMLARLNAALSQVGGAARQTNAQARRNLY